MSSFILQNAKSYCKDVGSWLKCRPCHVCLSLQDISALDLYGRKLSCFWCILILYINLSILIVLKGVWKLIYLGIVLLLDRCDKLCFFSFFLQYVLLICLKPPHVHDMKPYRCRGPNGLYIHIILHTMCPGYFSWKQGLLSYCYNALYERISCCQCILMLYINLFFDNIIQCLKGVYK